MVKPTVLVIDDNAIAREGLGVVLSRAGYDVALLEHGQQALTHLHAHGPPHVILLDMIMPVLDGWGFLEQFDKLQLQPNPAIIITTGNLVIGKEWASAHACAGFLRKPFDVDDMLREVQRCLQRVAPDPATRALQ